MYCGFHNALTWCFCTLLRVVFCKLQESLHGKPTHFLWACFTKPKPGRERSSNAAVCTPPPFFACFRPRCRRVDQIHFCTSDDQHPSSLQPHRKKVSLPSLPLLSVILVRGGKGKKRRRDGGGEGARVILNLPRQKKSGKDG